MHILALVVWLWCRRTACLLGRRLIVSAAAGSKVVMRRWMRCRQHAASTSNHSQHELPAASMCWRVPLKVTDSCGSLRTEPISISLVLQPFTITVACWTSLSMNDCWYAQYLDHRCVVNVLMSQTARSQWVDQDDECQWAEKRSLWHSSYQLQPVRQEVANLHTLPSVSHEGTGPPHDNVRQTQLNQRGDNDVVVDEVESPQRLCIMTVLCQRQRASSAACRLSVSLKLSY